MFYLRLTGSRESQDWQVKTHHGSHRSCSPRHAQLSHSLIDATGCCVPSERFLRTSRSLPPCLPPAACGTRSVLGEEAEPALPSQWQHSAPHRASLCPRLQRAGAMGSLHAGVRSSLPQRRAGEGEKPALNVCQMGILLKAPGLIFNFFQREEEGGRSGPECSRNIPKWLPPEEVWPLLGCLSRCRELKKSQFLPPSLPPAGHHAQLTEHRGALLQGQRPSPGLGNERGAVMASNIHLLMRNPKISHTSVLVSAHPALQPNSLASIISNQSTTCNKS